MQNNLHIVINSFVYESRVLKETASLVRSGMVQHVYIAALHEEGLNEREQIDDARTVWRASLRSRWWSRSLPVQVIKYFEFCARIIQYARTKNIDVINIHSLALLPLGVLLKRICGAKLVYDAHELETETFGLIGFRQMITRYVERIFIKYVDLTIVVGDAISKWYCDEYGISNIVTVMNCPIFQKPERSQRLGYDLGIPEEKKILIYQGGLVGGRGIEKLLKVFADHDDNKHVLVLMGYGELESLIREYAGKHNNIFLKEAVDPAVVLNYTASADAGIAFIENPCLNDYFCLPNKLFEYIMAGLPVIVNDVPEMRRVVQEYQIGIVLDNLTAHSLYRALNDIDNMNQEILTANLLRTKEIFSWENQEKIMLNAYRQYIFHD